MIAEDLLEEAYSVSSNFSFKDFKRSIIEHGKECYIDGIKRGQELVVDFLVSRGFISKEDLPGIESGFDDYLRELPSLNEATCNSLLQKSSCLRAVKLNEVQTGILASYNSDFTDDKRTMVIKKARQLGVSVILSIIGIIESKSGKRVLYLGYENPYKHLALAENKHNSNLVYREIQKPNSKRSDWPYDLIIIDEITCVEDVEYDYEFFKKYLLGPDGKMIVVGTPTSGKRGFNTGINGNGLKGFLTENKHPEAFIYATGPRENAQELTAKYEEMKEEVYGEYFN